MWGIMHMILTDQKGFDPTPVDYIFVDLDYKLLKGGYKKSGQKSAY
jgi:hypothetical protein